MTLPDRATVRAVGRPQFAAMLAAQGRPVLVRRAGQTDVESRALLIPVSSQSKKGELPSEPSFESLPWKAFFPHDADAVRERGFTLIAPSYQGQAGLALTPSGPTVDLADQGVAQMVLCTPLIDRTRNDLLTFTIPSSGLVTDPRTGNKVAAPGQQVSIPVRLAASDDPKVRDMAGADAADVVLLGRWGSLEAPQLRPEGVRWGSSSPLVLDGQKGTLTIKLAYPDPDLWQETQFGQRFVASWKAA